MTESRTDWQCESCPGERYLAPYGNEDSPIAVVGEQPVDAHPSNSDHAFALDLDETQRSSEILEKVFGELDIEWDDLYWTNALKCPSVRNRDDCLGTLEEELSDFSRVIVLGRDTRDMMPEDGQYDIVDIWHPAYLLRDPERFDEYVENWTEALGDAMNQKRLGEYR